MTGEYLRTSSKLVQPVFLFGPEDNHCKIIRYFSKILIFYLKSFKHTINVSEQFILSEYC